MQERRTRSVFSRQAVEQPSTINRPTRQERRERRALRLKRNVLKVLSRSAPAVIACIVLVLALTTPLAAETSFVKAAQNVVSLFNTLAPLIGIIGVILVGISFVMGDPHAARSTLYVGVGLCMMLGAAQIVEWIST